MSANMTTNQYYYRWWGILLLIATVLPLCLSPLPTRGTVPNEKYVAKAQYKPLQHDNANRKPLFMTKNLHIERGNQHETFNRLYQQFIYHSRSGRHSTAIMACDKIYQFYSRYTTEGLETMRQKGQFYSDPVDFKRLLGQKYATLRSQVPSFLGYEQLVAKGRQLEGLVAITKQDPTNLEARNNLIQAIRPLTREQVVRLENRFGLNLKNAHWRANLQQLMTEDKNRVKIIQRELLQLKRVKKPDSSQIRTYYNIFLNLNSLSPQSFEHMQANPQVDYNSIYQTTMRSLLSFYTRDYCLARSMSVRQNKLQKLIKLFDTVKHWNQQNVDIKQQLNGWKLMRDLSQSKSFFKIFQTDRQQQKTEIKRLLRIHLDSFRGRQTDVEEFFSSLVGLQHDQSPFFPRTLQQRSLIGYLNTVNKLARIVAEGSKLNKQIARGLLINLIQKGQNTFPQQFEKQYQTEPNKYVDALEKSSIPLNTLKNIIKSRSSPLLQAESKLRSGLQPEDPQFIYNVVKYIQEMSPEYKSILAISQDQFLSQCKNYFDKYPQARQYMDFKQLAYNVQIEWNQYFTEMKKPIRDDQTQQQLLDIALQAFKSKSFDKLSAQVSGMSKEMYQIVRLDANTMGSLQDLKLMRFVQQQDKQPRDSRPAQKGPVHPVAIDPARPARQPQPVQRVQQQTIPITPLKSTEMQPFYQPFDSEKIIRVYNRLQSQTNRYRSVPMDCYQEILYLEEALKDLTSEQTEELHTKGTKPENLIKLTQQTLPLVKPFSQQIPEQMKENYKLKHIMTETVRDIMTAKTDEQAQRHLRRLSRAAFTCLGSPPMQHVLLSEKQVLPLLMEVGNRKLPLEQRKRIALVGTWMNLMGSRIFFRNRGRYSQQIIGSIKYPGEVYQKLSHQKSEICHKSTQSLYKLTVLRNNKDLAALNDLMNDETVIGKEEATQLRKQMEGRLAFKFEQWSTVFKTQKVVDDQGEQIAYERRMKTQAIQSLLMFKKAPSFETASNAVSWLTDLNVQPEQAAQALKLFKFDPKQVASELEKYSENVKSILGQCFS